jgi:hypothetical protein
MLCYLLTEIGNQTLTQKAIKYSKFQTYEAVENRTQQKI